MRTHVMGMLVIGTVGCADAPSNESRPLTLAELPDLTVGVTSVPDTSALAPRRLNVAIGYATDRLDPTLCPQLGADVQVELAGLTPVIERGGWTAGEAQRCVPPSLAYTTPDELQLPDAALVLSDASRALRVPLGDLLVPRTLARFEGDDWQFRAGETVALRWSPSAGGNLVRCELSSTTGARAPSPACTLVGDRLTLAMPGAPFVGTLTVFVTQFDSTAEYAFVQQHVARHDVVVAL